MPTTDDLKRGMLASCNAIRVAMSADPLAELPTGDPCDPEICPGANALAGLSLGSLQIRSSQILIDRQFARMVKATWGTDITRCNCGLKGNHPCGRIHVGLPPQMQDFIAAFDNMAIPELISPDYVEDLGQTFAGATA